MGDHSWDHCANAATRRAARRLGQLYDAALAPSGLRTTQFSLLSEIGLSDGPTVAALARALAMDLSALAHTLKPLVRDGLVELVPDARDRRARRVRLTTAGRERHAQALPLWQDAQARFDAAFGAAESAALCMAMDRIASDDFSRAFAAGAPRPAIVESAMISG